MVGYWNSLSTLPSFNIELEFELLFKPCKMEDDDFISLTKVQYILVRQTHLTLSITEQLG